MADDEAAHPPELKRKRLSHACKACRARKVRCDERLPACTNCVKSKTECITDDPRKPHLASVKRTRASSIGITAAAPVSATPSEEPPADTKSLQSANDHRAHSARPRKSSVKQSHPPHRSADSSRLKDDEDTQLEQASAAATSSWADPTWMRNALGSSSASIISDSQAQDRFKYVGSSNLQVFSHWIDLLLAKQRASHDHLRRQAPDAAISDHFDHGRIHSEEYQLPLRPVLPALTHLAHFDDILNDFFNDANAVFPVFDEEVLRRDAVRFIQQYRLDDASLMRLDLMAPYEVPLLATIYIVTAISLLDATPRQPDQVKIYLDAAYSLYGHIIGVPYLSSVQALLMLHLVLRASSKDGAAWQALSSAIRIAYSIGLHRAPPSPPLHSAALEKTKARIWWCCYALDRIATLDSGRPTMINDLDVQLSAPRPIPKATPIDAASPKAEGLPDQVYNERYLACLVSLCRLKAEIHNALYTSRNQTVDESELFSTIASLDQRLLDWSSTCLTSLHLPTMSSEEALRAVSKPRDLQTLHLLCTFHFTVINVHRASVMLDTRLYRHHVASKLTRRKDRLLSAETICRGSARAIIRCINQYCLVHRCSTRMISGTISLSAVYVLAICIFKHPQEWNVSSDLALIDSIAKKVSKDYSDDGMPSGFTSIFATLQRLAVQCVRCSVSRPPSPPVPDKEEKDKWHGGDVSLEPFWKSLGFGNVLSNVDDSMAGAAIDGTQTTAIAEQGATAGGATFQSLLQLDQPDELLCSLLGLPDFFTPTNADGAFSFDPVADSLEGQINSTAHHSAI
ncbi:Transcription factor [Pseudozyma hubeiensis]|nr:Transcription factor [Pseudozyma hubeiensis]